jgi:pimeloyl-ACP methyl ester carboxylesterase
MPRASVDGTTLAYDVTGDGAPVLFIHGAFIADAFRSLLAEPALGQYRLVTYHRRGYAGSSPAAGPVTVRDQAADALRLLRRLGIDRVHVVGHSFGGSIALQLALDAPDVVHSLVLLETALFVGSSAEGYRASLRQSVRQYREAGAAVAVEDFLRMRWPGFSPAALEASIPGALAQAVADAATTYGPDMALLEWSFGEPEARRVLQPALVVLGGGSERLSPRFGETYRFLLAHMPHSEGLILPGATHFLHIESPANARALADAVATFFVRHHSSHAADPGGLS